MLSKNREFFKIIFSGFCLFSINLNGLTLKESVLEVVDKNSIPHNSFKENKSINSNENIAFNITNLYIDVIRNRELLENATQSFVNSERIYKNTLKLYIQGKVSKVEMTKVYEFFSQAKINLSNQQNNMTDKELEFKEFLGKKIDIMTFSIPSLDFNKIEENPKNNSEKYLTEFELNNKNILDLLQTQSEMFNSKKQIINMKMDKLYNKYKTLNDAGILIKRLENEENGFN